MNEEKIYLPSYEQLGLPPSIFVFYLQKSDQILPLLIFINFILQLASFYYFESMDDDNFEIFFSSMLYSSSFAVNLFFNFDFLLKILLFEEAMSLKYYSFFFLAVDAISGPLAFIFNIYLMFNYSEFTLGMLHCLLTLKILTVRSIRKLLIRIYRIIPLILPIIFYIFLIIYLVSSIGSKYFPEIHIFDWGNHLKALFAAFRTFTFDCWGGVIKTAFDRSAIIEALLMVFIVIFDGICLMNFFYACVIDFLSISKDPKKIAIIIDRNYQRLEKHNSFFMHKIIAGSYYSYFMMLFFVLFFAKDALEVDHKSESFKIIFSITIILFNFHFFIYFLYMKNKWGQMKDESRKKEKLAFMLNLVCGPIALIILIYGLYSNGEVNLMLNSILILKVFTIDRLKYLIFDNMYVAINIFPIFLLIFIFSFCLAFVGADIFHNYPDSFGNLNIAFVTILQIVTLDGWNEFLDHASFELACFFELSIIIIFQWSILSIMIVKSCDVMRDFYFKAWKLKNILPSEIKKEESILISNLNKVINNIDKIEIIGQFFSRKKFHRKKMELNKHLDCEINVEDSNSLKFLEDLKKSLRDEKQMKVSIKFEEKEIRIRADKMFKLMKFNNNVVKCF